MKCLRSVRPLVCTMGVLCAAIPIGLWAGLPWAGREDATPVEVRIIQTADLHGVLGDENDSGGWLKAAALIRNVRDTYGAQNTLLIDCGDTCQGSPVATLSRGEVGVRLLNHLAYDVWVPGNHEFDFGLTDFLHFTRTLSDITLCGNVRIDRDDDLKQEFPAWRMFERNGARIAVIGATASYMRHWQWGPAFAGIRVETARVMLDRILGNVLAEKPDAVVLACHQGWLPNDTRGINEVREIAETFPEIDLILGGHTHRPVPGVRIGYRSWYVQPGQHGEFVGVVTVLIDPVSHRVVEMSSRLLPTDDPTLVCDRDASDAVAQWRDRWRELAVKPVGSLAEAVLARGTPGINCETSELLSRAIAEAADVPVVLHGRLSRADLPAGTVREEQLFDIVPYENTVVRLSVTVEQLEDLVEEQLESRGTYVFCGLFGVHVTVDGTGEAQVRKADLAALGSTLRNGRLRIAVNSYTASGGGGRFPLMRRLVDDPDSRAGDTGLLTRDAVRTFLAHHPDLTVEARNWLRVRRAGAPRRQETEAR